MCNGRVFMVMQINNNFIYFQNIFETMFKNNATKRQKMQPNFTSIDYLAMQD